MKHTALLLSSFFTLSFARVEAETRVAVADASGKFVKTVSYIKLAHNRIGVPASTFTSMGLAVGYDAKERRLYISIPETDATIALRSGSRRIYSPVGGYEKERYPYPLALKRHGRFYVSVAAVHRSFPEYFTYQWDQSNRSLLLKPRR